MKKLFIILIIVFLISLLLTFLSFESKLTAIQIIKDMGLGNNFANTLECYNRFQEIKTPEEQMTLWGNAIPIKKNDKKLKKIWV